MSFESQIVDVFADGPFTGNPLAVVANADKLDTQMMQRITRWINLSETTFLLQPTDTSADYRVRIFTPERELAFAGHPTLGSCHAWLAAGGVPRDPECIVQQCGVGLVPVRRTGDMLAFAAPALLRSGPVDAVTRVEVAAFLRIPDAAIMDIAWADNGPGWVGVRLTTADYVRALQPMRDYPRPIYVGVIGPCANGADTEFEVRTFFSDHHGAVREDPVTGSFNAAVAQWLLAQGLATAPYRVAQGGQIGHRGRVLITQDTDGTIWVGGRTCTMFEGAGGY